MKIAVDKKCRCSYTFKFPSSIDINSLFTVLVAYAKASWIFKRKETLFIEVFYRTSILSFKSSCPYEHSCKRKRERMNEKTEACRNFFSVCFSKRAFVSSTYCVGATVDFSTLEQTLDLGSIETSSQ